MAQKKELLLGAHMSIAGGFDKSIERALATGSSTMQIFTKSNQMWAAKPINPNDALLFKETLKESGLTKIVAHAAYLINLGAQDENIQEKSRNGLILEINRCDELGIPYLVIHPGAHTGGGEEKALKLIAHNIDKVFDEAAPKTMILLESTAGQGTNVGYTFEQLRTIYDHSTHKERLGFCLDTCHIFAAGYDISTTDGYHKTIKHFDEIIGLEKLKAIHLNDSKASCNARIDRHAKIGQGHIPLEIFKLILTDNRIENIPKILETPVENPIEEYREEINMLKKLIST